MCITSESSVEIVWGEQITWAAHQKVMAAKRLIGSQPFQGLLEVVASYTSVSIFFDPMVLAASGLRSPAQSVLGLLGGLFADVEAKSEAEQSETTAIQIPTRYDGPDLQAVADALQLSKNQVVALHSQTVYTVFMIGFLPGFPYLGILPEALQLPRRDTPRKKVPAGSVAIAGAQTGVYPWESPGGWHLIGQTDFHLFDADSQPPARLQPGMKVRFIPL